MREMGQIMNYLKAVIPLAFLVVNVVQAAPLNTPQMLTPADSANLPLQKLAKFSWQKVAGATKYRVIFSNDKSFANYDANKFKCLNTKTCFMYTVASPSYNVAATHAMLKTDGNYFWQVQAVGKTTLDNSKKGLIRSFSVGTPTPPAIDSISVVPKGYITLGNAVQIRVKLDKPLAKDFYSIKISVNGEEFQPMTAAATESRAFYFYFTLTEIGEQQFQISLFDKNDIEIDSLGDSFTVVENSSEFEPIIPTPIIPNVTPNTPNEGTATSGSNKFDGNWNLKGTVDGSNCGGPSESPVMPLGVMPIKVTGNQVSFPFPVSPYGSVPSYSASLIDENTISYQVTFPTVAPVAGMPSFPMPSISGQLTYNSDGTISHLEQQSTPAMPAMPEFGIPATPACVMKTTSTGTKM